MSKAYALMMAYAMMGMLGPGPSNRAEDFELTPEEIENLNRVRTQKRKEIKLSKGLKEWNIDGITVIALNRKNAIRKADNIKKLMQ